MKRLFFALWPRESTRQAIDTLNASIYLTGVRKLRPSNLHVTLVFLGNVDDAMRLSMVARVDAMREKAFTFSFDGIEHWQASKTICLTTSHQPPALLALVGSLNAVVKDYPIFMHDRPYRVHVTLMRKAKQDYPLSYQPIIWQANDFVLVESQSTEDGIRYTVLNRWPLIV